MEVAQIMEMEARMDFYYKWSKLSGLGGDTIESAGFPMTNIWFSNAGSYVYQLEIDDQKAVNNTASSTVQVNVAWNAERISEPAQRFLRLLGEMSELATI